MQWAERLLLGGETEQWGDKWEERFKDGSGNKKVWHCMKHMPASVLHLGRPANAWQTFDVDCMTSLRVQRKRHIPWIADSKH